MVFYNMNLESHLAGVQIELFPFIRPPLIHALERKKIYLFATSGGSEMNKTAECLLPFMKNASIAGEKLVKASEGVEGLKEWGKSNIS